MRIYIIYLLYIIYRKIFKNSWPIIYSDLNFNDLSNFFRYIGINIKLIIHTRLWNELQRAIVLNFFSLGQRFLYKLSKLEEKLSFLMINAFNNIIKFYK